MKPRRRKVASEEKDDFVEDDEDWVKLMKSDWGDVEISEDGMHDNDRVSHGRRVPDSDNQFIVRVRR